MGGDDWSGPTFTGSQLVTVFDPWASSPATAWSVVKTGPLNQPVQLQRRRWYPTVLRMADAEDTVGVFGGVETWDFSTNMVNPAEYAHRTYGAIKTNVQGPTGPWGVDRRTGITIGTPQLGLFGGPMLATSMDEFYYYPRMHLLSRQALQSASTLGITWMAAMVTESAWVEHSGFPMVWPASPRPILPNGHTMLEEPATIVFPNVSPLHEDLIVAMGGQDGHVHSGTITNKVWMLPGKNAAPMWTNFPSLDLRYARKFHKAVLLPDTSVLLVGGGQVDTHGGTGLEVFWPEVFLQGQWRYCAKEETALGVASPRTYHSCAVLLPSGEVMSCGGNTRVVDYQVFKPHYFDGTFKQPEWSVSSPTPTTIAYGQPFDFGFAVPFGQTLDKVVLTSPTSTTHAQDPGQRCTQLTFLVHDSGQGVTAVAPPSASHAIPGCYMLWLVSSAGVPSVARWVFLQ